MNCNLDQMGPGYTEPPSALAHKDNISSSQCLCTGQRAVQKSYVIALFMFVLPRKLQHIHNGIWLAGCVYWGEHTEIRHFIFQKMAYLLGGAEERSEGLISSTDSRSAAPMSLCAQCIEGLPLDKHETKGLG